MSPWAGSSRHVHSAFEAPPGASVPPVRCGAAADADLWGLRSAKLSGLESADVTAALRQAASGIAPDGPDEFEARASRYVRPQTLQSERLRQPRSTGPLIRWCGGPKKS